jgi:hypothetical protein
MTDPAIVERRIRIGAISRDDSSWSCVVRIGDEILYETQRHKGLWAAFKAYQEAEIWREDRQRKIDGERRTRP